MDGDPPFRGVDILGVPAGQATSFADLVAICRTAGLGELNLYEPGVVEWRGGGANQWR
ncbi:hypothetical protein [Streptacidiphilus sp. PAMC 29251]